MGASLAGLSSLPDGSVKAAKFGDNKFLNLHGDLYNLDVPKVRGLRLLRVSLTLACVALPVA